jgi:cell division protein FtsL
MMEFITVKRIDNSRLARKVALREWRNCFRSALLGSLLAGFVLVYAWQHFRCLAVQYQLEELKAQRVEAMELNSRLKLQGASLRAPGRIDELARGELGLTVPVPGQVSPAVPQSGTLGAILAQVHAGSATPAP